MATHTNQWRPDTCGCVLEYEWDDAEPMEVRTHTPTRTVFDCGAHGEAAGTKAHHARVLGENQHKNKVVEALKDGAEAPVEWEFNAARELTIKVDPARKAAAMAHLDSISPGRKVHIL